jgi:hypothetical protein
MSADPLNCKQGDIALIVKGDSGGIRNTGKLVTCLSLEDPPGPPHPSIRAYNGRFWRVDRVLPWRTSSTRRLFETPFVPDAWLLPIQPEPGPIEEATAIAADPWGLDE